MLREIRQKKGFTIFELSQKSGVCSSSISEYERGIKQLSLKSIRQLAYVLKVQPGELIEPIDFAPPFDHNVPDQCPFAVNERPSSCSECPNSGGCPFFTYEEEEDD